MLRSTVQLSLRARGTRVAPLISRKPLGSLTLSQSSAVLVRSVPAAGVLNVRSYWWSKSSTTATEHTKTTTPSPLEQVVPSNAGSASASLGAPHDTTGASSDTITHTSTTSSDLGISPDALASTQPPETLQVASDVADALNLIPPLQHGDFAALGLISYSPVGLVTWSFEALQVATGMPWFYTIIAGTLLWRALILPSAIGTIRNASLLRPFAKEMKDIDEKLLTADHTTRIELGLTKQRIMQQSGFTFRPAIVGFLAQVPVQLSLFFGVRRIVTLPVEQLKDSGFAYLPDLTVPDPHFVLPALILGLTNLSITLAKKDADSIRQAHTMNGLRVFSMFSVPFLMWMPSGLWLSVATGLVVSVLQSAILRLPVVQRKLSIHPVVVSIPEVTMKDTLMAFGQEMEGRFGGQVPPSAATNPMRPKNSGVSIRR